MHSNMTKAGKDIYTYMLVFLYLRSSSIGNIYSAKMSTFFVSTEVEFAYIPEFAHILTYGTSFEEAKSRV